MKQSTMKLITNGAALLVLTLISCNKEIVLSDESAYESQLQIAVTKSGEPEFKVTLSDVEWLIESLYPDAGAYEIEAYPNDEEPLMYAVNFENGWKIVSGDKRTDPILAFNEDGKMWINDNSNPGFNMWLEEVSESIKKLEGIKEEDEKNLKFWKYNLPLKLGYETKSGSGRWYRELMGEYLQGSYVNIVNPLLATKWGQGYPWNLHAPLAKDSNTVRCLLGCGPVALSQILYYCHFHNNVPLELYHSINCYAYDYSYVFVPGFGICWKAECSFSRGSLTSPSGRWMLMPTDTTSALSNLTYAKYVEDFILDVGNRLNAEYLEIGTGSGTASVVPAMSNYGLTGTLSDYNYNYVYNDLTNYKPVFITGVDGSSGLGHAWVIDGHRQDLITIRRVYIWHEADSNWQGITYSTAEAQAMLGDDDILAEGVGYLETTEELGPKYFHMNWGWSGYENGYFVIASPWLDYYPDKIVYNIHPIQ